MPLLSVHRMVARSPAQAQEIRGGGCCCTMLVAHNPGRISNLDLALSGKALTSALLAGLRQVGGGPTLTPRGAVFHGFEGLLFPAVGDKLGSGEKS